MNYAIPLSDEHRQEITTRSRRQYVHPRTDVQLSSDAYEDVRVLLLDAAWWKMEAERLAEEVRQWRRAVEGACDPAGETHQ